MGDQEGAAGQRRATARQPARRPGRVVVEGLAGDQDQVGDPIASAGADDELRAAPASWSPCSVRMPIRRSGFVCVSRILQAVTRELKSPFSQKASSTGRAASDSTGTTISVTCESSEAASCFHAVLTCGWSRSG